MKDRDAMVVFNKSFISVFTTQHNFREAIVGQKNGEGMLDFVPSLEEIKDILEKFDVRKAMGPDGVSNWILRECSSQLAGVMQNIINAILSREVPKDWKRADMTPIYKSGNKEEPLNYRPVSLTSTIAKI